MSTQAHKIPGQTVFERLCARGAQRPGIGPSPMFYERLGLGDPWRFDGRFDVDAQSEMFSFLSAAPYYERLRAGEGASARARQRLLGRIDRDTRASRFTAFRSRLSAPDQATGSWLRTSSLASLGASRLVTLERHDLLPTEEVAEAAPARRPRREVRARRREARPMERAFRQAAPTTDARVQRALEEIGLLARGRSRDDFGRIVDEVRGLPEAKQMAAARRAVRAVRGNLGAVARAVMEEVGTEVDARAPGRALDVARGRSEAVAGRAPSAGKSSRGLRPVLSQSPALTALRFERPSEVEPEQPVVRRRAVARPARVARQTAHATPPVASVVRQARTQQEAGRAGPAVAPARTARQEASRTSVARRRPTEWVATLAADSQRDAIVDDVRYGFAATGLTRTRSVVRSSAPAAGPASVLARDVSEAEASPARSAPTARMAARGHAARLSSHGVHVAASPLRYVDADVRAGVVRSGAPVAPRAVASRAPTAAASQTRAWAEPSERTAAPTQRALARLDHAEHGGTRHLSVTTFPTAYVQAERPVVAEDVATPSARRTAGVARAVARQGAQARRDSRGVELLTRAPTGYVRPEPRRRAANSGEMVRVPVEPRTVGQARQPAPERASAAMADVITPATPSSGDVRVTPDLDRSTSGATVRAAGRGVDVPRRDGRGARLLSTWATAHVAPAVAVRSLASSIQMHTVRAVAEPSEAEHAPVRSAARKEIVRAGSEGGTTRPRPGVAVRPPARVAAPRHGAGAEPVVRSPVRGSVAAAAHPASSVGRGEPSVEIARPTARGGARRSLVVEPTRRAATRDLVPVRSVTARRGVLSPVPTSYLAVEELPVPSSSAMERVAQRSESAPGVFRAADSPSVRAASRDLVVPRVDARGKVVASASPTDYLAASSRASSSSLAATARASSSSLAATARASSSSLAASSRGASSSLAATARAASSAGVSASPTSAPWRASLLPAPTATVLRPPREDAAVDDVLMSGAARREARASRVAARSAAPAVDGARSPLAPPRLDRAAGGRGESDRPVPARDAGSRLVSDAAAPARGAAVRGANAGVSPVRVAPVHTASVRAAASGVDAFRVSGGDRAASPSVRLLERASDAGRPWSAPTVAERLAGPSRFDRVSARVDGPEPASGDVHAGPVERAAERSTPERSGRRASALGSPTATLASRAAELEPQESVVPSPRRRSGSSSSARPIWVRTSRGEVVSALPTGKSATAHATARALHGRDPEVRRSTERSSPQAFAGRGVSTAHGAVARQSVHLGRPEDIGRGESLGATAEAPIVRRAEGRRRAVRPAMGHVSWGGDFQWLAPPAQELAPSAAPERSRPRVEGPVTRSRVEDVLRQVSASVRAMERAERPPVVGAPVRRALDGAAAARTPSRIGSDDRGVLQRIARELGAAGAEVVLSGGARLATPQGGRGATRRIGAGTPQVTTLRFDVGPSVAAPSEWAEARSGVASRAGSAPGARAMGRAFAGVPGSSGLPLAGPAARLDRPASGRRVARIAASAVGGASRIQRTAQGRFTPAQRGAAPVALTFGTGGAGVFEPGVSLDAASGYPRAYSTRFAQEGPSASQPAWSARSFDGTLAYLGPDSGPEVGASVSAGAARRGPARRAGLPAAGRVASSGASGRSRTRRNASVGAGAETNLSAPQGFDTAGGLGAAAPGWARRAVDGDVPGHEPAARAMRSGGGLLTALARAGDAEDLVRVILERSDGARSLSSALPSPAVKLIERIVRLHDDDEIAARGARPVGRSGGAEANVAAQGKVLSTRRSHASSPVHKTLSRGAAGAKSSDGVGSSQVMKLANKLMKLIHLAEVDRRKADAQAQVRMAEDSASARAEGGSQNAGTVKMSETDNIQALQRDVLDAVLRELELNLMRNQGDPDGWW